MDLLRDLIYQNKERQSYQQLLKGYSEDPLIDSDLNLDEDYFNKLVAEFK